MNSIKINGIYLLLSILLLTACKEGQRSISQNNSGLESRIDSIGEKFVNDGKVMGFSIAIVKKDSVMYNNSFGYVDSLQQIPVTNDHYFLMASISKLVGSTIVMKLVEEGTLDLDDSLSYLLPDFPNQTQGEKIRLRHLISMTSGLKEYSSTIDSVYMATGKSPTKEDYYEFFGANELEFEPGSHYKYVNSGFVLMAMIVERATEKSFQGNIDRIINKPTGFDIQLISKRIEDPIMSEHFQLNDGKISRRKHWPWIKGDGGMTNTALQLARFPYQWMNGSIISQNSFKSMKAKTYLSSGYYSEYGFGVKNGDFEGELMFGHSGGDATTYSMMFHFPRISTTIVTMVNTNRTTANARQIFSEVALIALEKKKPDFRENEVLEDNLIDFVGGYLIPGDSENKTAYIVHENESKSLYYTFDKNPKNGERMYNLGNGVFWIEKWPYDRLRFERDSANNVVALKEFYGGYMSRIRPKLTVHDNIKK
ncbi:serine hydrolase domain-containing protein [uncultured Croceitalea sp.]|uniref:serine hydrolase domain-containing protein n=1 Tax=uncultured Croceitalea sp. TaxID=1798908 RepID=UPI003305E1FC